MKLREYQQRSIDQLMGWLSTNEGHPVVELPTGSGKSLLVAELCRIMVQDHGQRVLMLTHSKELIAQNAERMVGHWPNAPLGVYSAGLNKRQMGHPITFAGIQSVRKRAAEIGHVAVVVVDECDLISHENQGMYRLLINDLKAINPKLRVVGLTATPYRLGHGLITDEPAIFKEIISPTSIEELIYKGFLSPLRSKTTGLKYDTSAVHKRGGEFIESELQAAVDSDDQNDEIAREVIARAEGRKSWLFFCSGVLHAIHMRDSLRAHGVTAECVTGDTPEAQRDDIIRRYKSGEITALVNVNVLTVGFDHPGIDLIAMCRPTMSPRLYVQMGGRGLRICEGKTDCLVLDFAGVVEAHGPITAVQTPDKIVSGGGEAPSKLCDDCHEIVAASCRECPTCGAEFPEPEKAPLVLHDDDIMAIETKEMEVESWAWVVHTSKQSGKEMLRVDYYGAALEDPKVSEYLCLKHEGFALKKAKAALTDACLGTGVTVYPDDELEAIAGVLQGAKPPEKLAYKRDGQFWRIIDKVWAPVTEPVDYDELLDGDQVPF